MDRLGAVPIRCAAVRRRLLAFAAAAVVLSGLTPTSVPVVPAAAEPKAERWRPGARHADFDRDGFADLAISYTGAVRVIYGSASGLRPARNQRWTLKDLPAAPATDESLGNGTAVGDFNGDQYTDLATIAFGSTPYTVHVVYGSSTGLSASGSNYLPVSRGVVSHLALSVGDFGNGPQADLAVGRSYVGGGAGVVDVMYGSAAGLKPQGQQRWTQNSPGIRGSAADSDGFGEALAAGNFGGGPHDDLAVGAPGEGAVNVIYGSDRGLTATGNQLWTPRTQGLRTTGHVDEDNYFGGDLAAGHFAGRQYADLAIGSDMSLGRREARGAVNVIYGSGAGLTTTGNQLWTERTPGIVGKAGQDNFGGSLSAGNFGRDAAGEAFDDLAIGASSNGDSPIGLGGGAVHVIYGSAGGLNAAGNQKWSQNRPGIPGVSEDADGFGDALASANFGRDDGDQAYADLAIGSPEESADGGAGRVHVLYGTDTGLEADGVQVWTDRALGRKPLWGGFVDSLSASS